MELRDLKVGMYFRTKVGTINKIDSLTDDKSEFYFDTKTIFSDGECLGSKWGYTKDIIKASDKLIDLVEYMNLLVIENKVKGIDNKEVYFFNPVRCDGFTTFENNQHCMIINMDYIIPIENIKIYQILTKEMFDQISYKVGE